MSRSSICNYDVLVIAVIIDDTGHRLPAVLNVIEISPQITTIDDGGVIWLQEKIENHCIIYQKLRCGLVTLYKDSYDPTHYSLLFRFYHH